jgi:excisionase family DNA binding protein
MSERLLTAREVGELLGVSAETVLRWTRAGKLRAIRLPGTSRGRLRYRPEDVEAWLEAHETGAADREVLPTRPNRARGGGYASLSFSSLPTPPRDAAKTEEDT